MFRLSRICPHLPELHRHLVRVAAERHSSLAELVRQACEREFGAPSREEKLGGSGTADQPSASGFEPGSDEARIVTDARKLAP